MSASTIPLSSRPPVENEAGKIEELVEIIRRMQAKDLSIHGYGFRGTHVKTQAVVKGVRSVDSNLQFVLAHGIASPENASRPHPVAIRFANEPSFMQDDRAPGTPGCAMKILDVAGTFMDR